MLMSRAASEYGEGPEEIITERILQSTLDDKIIHTSSKGTGTFWPILSCKARVVAPDYGALECLYYT